MTEQLFDVKVWMNRQDGIMARRMFGWIAGWIDDWIDSGCLYGEMQYSQINGSRDG